MIIVYRIEVLVNQNWVIELRVDAYHITKCEHIENLSAKLGLCIFNFIYGLLQIIYIKSL